MSKKSKSETESLPPVDFVEADKNLHRFRTRYDDLQPLISDNYKLEIDPSENMTKQSFQDEVNINNIIAKYKVTGVLPNSSRAALAQFGDFTEVPSYQDALNTVMHAQEVFSELPSGIRNRFNNDPGEMLQFLADSNNREEAAKMGLLDPSTGKAPAASQEAQAPTSPPANPNPSASKDAPGGK